ncbi:hypothetical protein B9Z55_025223 [Caenorhabditis nigoni]|uniref:Uncharacterized protein n=1 Tax=Caenorhabditis nigoni TaxID=1611254 RepID=A0A2G5SXH4_9PELO|nr:hypothetical protein B9Z55_025223 [Caenorhabditis nigoni]
MCQHKTRSMLFKLRADLDRLHEKATHCLARLENPDDLEKKCHINQIMQKIRRFQPLEFNKATIKEVRILMEDWIDDIIHIN